MIVFIVLCLCQVALSEDNPLRGPPQFETKPMLLNSYLPATMQIIVHVTDLMKYDLKPGAGSVPLITTTTARPTSTHKPGLYAPETPLGPQASKGVSYEEYVHILQNSEGQGYFDKYKFSLDEARNGRDGLKEDIPDDVDYLLGKDVAELLKLTNHLEDEVTAGDDLDVVRDFSKNYDDDYRFEFRQKRIPPTRAYVSLLSLYDLLNKESKKMGLSKYQGYTENVLKDLAETSGGTSADQMKFVMRKVVENKDIRQENVLAKLRTTLTDLEQDDSYINNALRYIPPLRFSL